MAFAGRSVCTLGKLNLYISPSALPLYCKQHIKRTDRVAFGPADNHFQLKAEVSSAELWKLVAAGGPLEGL